jgi:type I restriction enzyme S subunit
MSANPDPAAPTGRKKPAQGKERSDAALGHASPNTSSLEGAGESCELPKGWRWVTLGDVAESMKNGLYKPASSYADDGLACLRMYNIGDGKIVWRDIKRMRLSEAEIREYELLPGDLLVNRVNSRELVGKAVAVPTGLERCVFESKNIRVRIRRDLVSPEFVSYRLLSAGSRYFTQNAQQVVGMASISQPQVGRFPLPLPPLPEQRRIVAEIEKQFTRLEAGVAALRRVQANLKRYRAAVLKAACEGRLVPTEAALARSPRSTKNGPLAYETGEALLARILTERRQNWQGRGQYKEPAAPDTAKLPAVPEGWTWATPDQLSAVEDGAICAGPFGTIFKAHDFRHDGVPIIFLRHVAPGRYLTHKPGFMDAAKWEELFRPYSVFGGELLVTKLGEPPGVCAIYPKGIGPAMVTPDVMKMTPNSAAALPLFLMHYFNSQTARDFATGVAFGTTRLRLTLSIFREMPVPLPPLAEQARIVAEVERRLSVVEELESVVSANLQRATRLRQSILQKAFTGRFKA